MRSSPWKISFTMPRRKDGLARYAQRNRAAEKCESVLISHADRIPHFRRCVTFGGPPVDGLGTTGGFKVIIEDRGNRGLEYLQERSDQITQNDDMPGLVNSSRASTPWLYLDIDRTKCMTLGVGVSDIFQHLADLFGFLLRQQLQSIRPNLASQRTEPTRNTTARSAIFRQLQVRNSQGKYGPPGHLPRRPRRPLRPVMVMCSYNVATPPPRSPATRRAPAPGQAIST